MHSVFASQIILKPQDYVQQAFNGSPPAVKSLWLIGAIKTDIKKILGHDYHKLRLKYWQKEDETLWILDEIGKEKYITTGISVVAGKIVDLSVLVFRESRGWEVKYDFFTQQFNGVAQQPNTQLDQHIDAITGATLSVNALRKQARMALYLDDKVQAK